MPVMLRRKYNIDFLHIDGNRRFLIRPSNKVPPINLYIFFLQEDYAKHGLNAMRDDLLEKSMKLNVEYRNSGQAYVSLTDSNDQDVGRNLIMDGLMLAEKKGGRRLAKLVDSYLEAQESAKKNHLNIWEYGDITADDAKEFGHRR